MLNSTNEWMNVLLQKTRENNLTLMGGISGCGKTSTLLAYAVDSLVKNREVMITTKDKKTAMCYVQICKSLIKKAFPKRKVFIWIDCFLVKKVERWDYKFNIPIENKIKILSSTILLKMKFKHKAKRNEK